MEAYEQLERDFGKWMGYAPEQMVAVSSGTSAIHLALEVGVGPIGGKVLMSDLNMIACPRAATLAGLGTRFVDCDDRLNLDPGNLNWTCSTSAVLATHIYGRQCDMDRINVFADVRQLFSVEDLSELHGVTPHKHTDAACWSFYKNKIVAGEEGGMIAFRNSVQAAHARQLRSLGFTDSHNFQHVPRGINARMSNLHARAVLHSLNHVENNLDDRRLIESWYDELVPREWHMPTRDVVWVYDLRLPGEHLDHSKQNAVVKDLNELAIAARHCFKPCSGQAEYSKQPSPPNPVAYRESKRIIYLPVSPEMTKDRVKYIVEQLLRAVGV